MHGKSLMASNIPDKGQNSSKSTPLMTIRGTFHALLAVLTWILFVIWWNQVIPQVTAEDTSMAFLVIFLTVLICSVLTLLWVRYNVGIFRHKGPRKNLPVVSEEREADYLGRRLHHPGYDLLKASPLVVVSREEDRKKFNIPLGGRLSRQEARPSAIRFPEKHSDRNRVPVKNQKNFKVPPGA